MKWKTVRDLFINGELISISEISLRRLVLIHSLIHEKKMCRLLTCYPKHYTKRWINYIVYTSEYRRHAVHCATWESGKQVEFVTRIVNFDSLRRIMDIYRTINRDILANFLSCRGKKSVKFWFKFKYFHSRKSILKLSSTQWLQICFGRIVINHFLSIVEPNRLQWERILYSLIRWDPVQPKVGSQTETGLVVLWNTQTYKRYILSLIPCDESFGGDTVDLTSVERPQPMWSHAGTNGMSCFVIFQLVVWEKVDDNIQYTCLVFVLYMHSSNTKCHGSMFNPAYTILVT